MKMGITTKVKSAVFGELSALTSQKEKDEKEAERLRGLIRENQADYCARDENITAILAQLEQRVAEWDQTVKDSAGTEAKTVKGVAYNPGAPDYYQIHESVNFMCAITRPLWNDYIQHISKILPAGISATARAKKDAELKTQLLEVESRIEGVNEAIEDMGGVADRNPNLSPAVFLRYAGPSQFASEKLQRLREEAHAACATDIRVSDSLRDLSLDLQQARYRLDQTDGNNDKIKAEIKDLEQEIAAINKRRGPLDETIRRKDALFNSAIDFLRKEKVNVEKFLR